MNYFCNDGSKLLIRRPKLDIKIQENGNDGNYFDKHNELLNSWIRQQGSGNKLGQQFSKSSKRRLSKYLNVNKNDNENNYIKLPVIESKTDKLLNTYHTKWIDDVLKHNEPRNHLINDPKELIYLKKLPDLKMSVIGIGKTKDYVWELKNDLALAQLITTANSKYCL